MSDFGMVSRALAAAHDKLARLAELADEVSPQVKKAEPAVAAILKILEDHKAEFGL